MDDRTNWLTISLDRTNSDSENLRKIAELSQTGRYIVVEKAAKVVGHAFLDPMPLQAISHFSD